MRYWDAPPWTEHGRAEPFIVRCRQMADEGVGVRLAVDDAVDEKVLGWVSLGRWNPTFRSASLGYCYTEVSWVYGLLRRGWQQLTEQV